MSQEFPRMVYLGGVVRPGVKFWRIATDRENQKALAKDGFYPEGCAPGRFNGADPEKFDHDHKGGPGGAPKGGNRKRRA